MSNSLNAFFGGKPACLKNALAFVSIALLVLLPADAQAHIKWFEPYDLTSPPRSIYLVFTNIYIVVSCATLLPIMGFVGYADVRLVRNNATIKALLNKSNAWIEPQFFRLMQAGIFIFFTSIFWYGNLLLTPELITGAGDRKWVGALQLVIAVAVLSRRVAFLSGIGITVLYVLAAHRYGMFHLLDYPIFLGVAAYIFIVSLFGTSCAGLASNVLRVLTGITLMWAGIEKFAYPEWTFPLLQRYPVISFGLDSEFYMAAAGFIEFAAAFLLITGALASRAAAAVLLILLVSAIPIFGLIDAIGHALFIAVLILLVLSDNRISLSALLPHKTHTQYAILNVALFCIALAVMAALFYGGHQLYYGN